MFAHVDGPKFREFFARSIYGIDITDDDLIALLAGDVVHRNHFPRPRARWAEKPFSGFCLAWDTFFIITLVAEKAVDVRAVLSPDWGTVTLLQRAQISEGCTIDDLTHCALRVYGPDTRLDSTYFTGVPWEIVLIEDPDARQAARDAYIQTAALL